MACEVAKKESGEDEGTTGCRTSVFSGPCHSVGKLRAARRFEGELTTYNSGFCEAKLHSGKATHSWQ